VTKKKSLIKVRPALWRDRPSVVRGLVRGFGWPHSPLASSPGRNRLASKIKFNHLFTKLFSFLVLLVESKLKIKQETLPEKAWEYYKANKSHDHIENKLFDRFRSVFQAVLARLIPVDKTWLFLKPTQFDETRLVTFHSIWNKESVFTCEKCLRVWMTLIHFFWSLPTDCC
jgi:hypothetical protein